MLLTDQYLVKWGYSDKRGKITIQPQFAACETFCEDFARVEIGQD